MAQPDLLPLRPPNVPDRYRVLLQGVRFPEHEARRLHQAHERGRQETWHRSRTLMEAHLPIWLNLLSLRIENQVPTFLIRVKLL